MDYLLNNLPFRQSSSRDVVDNMANQGDMELDDMGAPDSGFIPYDNSNNASAPHDNPLVQDSGSALDAPPLSGSAPLNGGSTPDTPLNSGSANYAPPQSHPNNMSVDPGAESTNMSVDPGAESTNISSFAGFKFSLPPLWPITAQPASSANPTSSSVIPTAVSNPALSLLSPINIITPKRRPRPTNVEVSNKVRVVEQVSPLPQIVRLSFPQK